MSFGVKVEKVEVKPVLRASLFFLAALGLGGWTLGEELKGNDSAAAMAAVRELDGRAKDEVVVTAAKALLERDRLMVERLAGGIDVKKVGAAEKELAAVRAKAIENIRVLEKGEPVELQKRYHTKLKELVGKTNAANAAKWQMIEAMRRRVELNAILEKHGQKVDEGAEKMLALKVGAALGMDCETAMKIAEFGEGDDPHSDDVTRGLWFYRACRKIEAFNKGQAEGMNKWEMGSLKLLNYYRECLGLFPLELDPRLTQAARKHSKEMTDLKYFGHDSPTAGLHQPTDRMRKEGYDAGWRENIVGNVGDAERAFVLWFGSPGHHVAMCAPEETAIGVGRWDNCWTHEFGHGLRLMQMDEGRRKEALAGMDKPLAAQGNDSKLPSVTVTRVETEITVFDGTTGKKVVVPGTTTEPKGKP